MKPLTQMVVDYIEHEGIEVKVWRALEIADTQCHDPAKTAGHCRRDGSERR